ncbi:MAG: Do family serine endopeptidase [Spirochaetes bacterium]|nr:Do family serine endopeptidase [Spirochaetota bacterium]
MADKKLFNFKAAVMITGFLLAGMFFYSCSTTIPKGGEKVPAKSLSYNSIDALKSIQYSFNRVAEKVLPVVVEIDVEEVVKQSIPEGNWPWDFFFGSPPSGSRPKEKEFKKYGLGSGLIVNRIGNKVYVLTNNHVVGDAEKIKIKLYDQRQFKAKLVGKDSRKDIALVVFETKEKIPIAELGDSDNLKVGDWVLAVGNPLGFESTVTAGIVSALGRRGGPAGNINDFIQTDAAINQGNSGGALVNIDGKVVGMNTWITSPTGGSIGLGFAIPINNAKKAIQDFIKKGKVEYGWLGVNIGDPVPEVVKDLKVENKKGALVYDVFKGSPAYKGGLLPGDYITKVNNTQINNSNYLVLLVGDLPPGKLAKFTLIRTGRTVHLSIRIDIRKEEKKLIALKKNLWPGFSVVRVTDDIRERLKLPGKIGGLIIAKVESGSPAATAGLKQLDIIKSINDKDIRDVMDFYKTLNNKSDKELSFKVVRKGSEVLIGLVR